MYKLCGVFLSLAFAGMVHAQTGTKGVAGYGDIYCSQLPSVQYVGCYSSMSADGGPPSSLSLTGLNDYIMFSSITGSLNCGYANGCIGITSADPTYWNDPDGMGSQGGTSVSAQGSLSGIVLPNAGALLGVFVPEGGPSGTAPPTLNFTGNTSFTTISPQLDQVFFIGDGLTGDGSGSEQRFNIPRAQGLSTWAW